MTVVTAPSFLHSIDPAIRRLHAISQLDDVALVALKDAARRAHGLPARTPLLAEGARITETQLLLEGWAARVRHLPDGRRQIMSFVLPGDLLGSCNHVRAVASSTVEALTAVKLCVAPDRNCSPALSRCYAVSAAHDEANLLAQITRLGRMNAQERIFNLMLELLDRLELAGLASRGGFTLPLTQEMLADAVGLTPVHVNRTLQQARRNGDLEWTGRKLILHDPDRLREKALRQPVQVTYS